MKRNLVRTVALTLAIAFILSMVSTTQVKQANAAGWSAKTWTVPLVDNWGKPLGKAEARGYLYNSTGRTWANWVLLSTSTDVFTNSTGSYITFSHIPPTWNNTYGTITYTLVIKQEISGSVTPITIYNATVMTLSPTILGAGYYSDVFAKVDLGNMLQFGYQAANGNMVQPATPLVDTISQPIRVWLYYVALQVVDENGLPLTVTDVKVSYTSNWFANGTWVTTSSESGVVGGKYSEATANGTYDPPTNGLIPAQGPFRYVADPHVGWVILRVPLIDSLPQHFTGGWPAGQNRSLVNNMTFIFYYHGTEIGNFSATDLTAPASGQLAWVASASINAMVNAKFESVLALPGSPVTPVTLQGNHSYPVTCNVNWITFALYDQAGNPWPTRNAKITLYDANITGQYPWPGVISPDSPPLGPSLVLLRYPVVNHTLKVVTTWFDCTVNVTYVHSNNAVAGGFDMTTANGVMRYRLADGPSGLLTDMVRLWVKVFTSTQVPAPLDPNWVNEVTIRIESRAAPETTYISKLSYWHGYIILPDSPYSVYQGSGLPLPSDETTMSVGWLPNGTWTTTDFFVTYKGLEVVNTVTRYPVNRTLLLNCSARGTIGDYGRTFILYAGVYDIGFQVLLGSSHSNMTAPEGTPLFVTTPDMQRIILTTDGSGSVTLRDVPSGIYKDFVILYKMMPINSSNVKWAYVNMSTKPLIKLLFPAFYVNITVWNFEGTFKLVNLNASLYNTIDYSKFGITNDLLRRALDVTRKRSVVLPDNWAVITPVAVTSPNITTLIDYLGSNPMAYSTIMYRTQLWVTGRDLNGNLGTNGVPVWPLSLGLMPAANYSCRISVPNGTDRAVQAGFRPADYNATVYWSGDPYPGVGPIVVDASKAKDQTVSINIYTYIYNVPVQTLDASGQPLKLTDMSAIILAEPYDLVNGTDGRLISAGYHTPWQIWYMQQWDENATIGSWPYYNAYMVRFNSSDTNTFHSVNATRASPPTDPDLGTSAHNYPNQSRYLIGMSTLGKNDNYTFNVYYQGVLVFNDSIPLTNPYTIGTPGHSVTGMHKIKTSVYPYTFEATNNPLDSSITNSTFGIANLNVNVSWAGLNTTWWPTVNLTYRTAPEEFALLNATKMYKAFNMTVVKRLWGNVTGIETKQSIVMAANPPYYSSFVKIVNGTTDSNGEFKTMVPVWNYSVGLFPTFMGTLYDVESWPSARFERYIDDPWLGDVGTQALSPNSYNVTPSDALNPGFGDLSGHDFPFDTTIGGPRRPWIETSNTINMVYRNESLFGTAVFANYSTIPGKTNNVLAEDGSRLVGVAPGYEPWVNYASMNATGLINPKKGDIGGVSLTMNTRDGIRFYGIGVLLNNNNSKLIYGDFQGRSPELALIGTGPYKQTGNKIAPPQPVSNFFAKADSASMANDLWVTVQDYNGNNLSYQRVEVFREETITTLDNGSLKVLPPQLWTVQYTPRDPPYNRVKITSRPTAILWGMYNVCVRTTNLTDAVVNVTTVVRDNASQEVKNLELYGIQWRYGELQGGSQDWASQDLILKWEAKLDVQIKAGDGSTPIEKAWVYLCYGTNWAHGGGGYGDSYYPPLNLTRVGHMSMSNILLPHGAVSWGFWEISQNVTAAQTDKVGYAGSLVVGPGRAVGALATSDGTTLNLGFNVYPDVYTVKVYYKFKGESTIYGPVEGMVVWDTFTDQPQHRYIYLGIVPPPTATGEDYSNAQVKIYGGASAPVRIWGVKLTIVDQSAAARPIAGAMVNVSGLGTSSTGSDGSVAFSLAPSGTYSMTAMWQSKYNNESVTIAKSTITLSTTMDQIVPATVYDVELQLVSPSGKPISGASMFLGNVSLGMTGADGKVVATQVPSKYTEKGATAYPVNATWLGVNVSPGPVTITASRTYILTASKVATLTVQVVGAQGQGLDAAQVDIKNSNGTTVFSGVSNQQGVASIEVPYGTYSVHTNYKGFTSDQSTTINSANPAPVTTSSNVFIELFGQAMTFATFVLWIIVIIIVVLVLSIVIHEYHVWRRKRLPQLFGAPRVPGA